MRTVKSLYGKKVVERQQKELGVEGGLNQRATVDVLPDDVLLEIFKFYLDGGHHVVDAWHKLVQVCRRWREVVFASPRRLNLRLLCTSERPVKMLMDIWPALPIVIDYSGGMALGPGGITNINAALEHNDRVCEITLHYFPSAFLDKFVRFASIKEPFPALITLDLRSCYYDEPAPTLPDSFLDGSAPHLRNLKLEGIPFPGLPKLLLSAHHLVDLRVYFIPDSGYISSKAMVTCLSSLTHLKLLELGYQLPRSRPDQLETNRHQPVLTHTVLPSLTSLSLDGVNSEYLEDILARIDVPLLNYIHINFFSQPIFDTPLLRSLISRTEAFKTFDRVHIVFLKYGVEATLLSVPEGGAYKEMMRLGIYCEPSDLQLLFMARVCDSSLPPLPTLECLGICEYLSGSSWQDDLDTQWLELFHPFITVKTLYLDIGVARRVALALEELAGERVTEVLPALQNAFVEGPVQQGIAEFIAARQLLGHPVTIHDWDKE